MKREEFAEFLDNLDLKGNDEYIDRVFAAVDQYHGTDKDAAEEAFQSFFEITQRKEFTLNEILERYESDKLHLRWMNTDPSERPTLLADDDPDGALYDFVLYNNYLDEGHIVSVYGEGVLELVTHLEPDDAMEFIGKLQDQEITMPLDKVALALAQGYNIDNIFDSYMLDTRHLEYMALDHDAQRDHYHNTWQDGGLNLYQFVTDHGYIDAHDIKEIRAAMLGDDDLDPPGLQDFNMMVANSEGEHHVDVEATGEDERSSDDEY